MTITLGRLLAVAEFETDVLEVLDALKALKRRAEIGTPAFAKSIEVAYSAVSDARYEIDSWKDGPYDRR